MIQEEIVAKLVREVLRSIDNNSLKSAACSKDEIKPDTDYPLAAKRPELLKTPTGKKLSDITLEKVLKGEVKPEDVRITPETLKLQSKIAEGVGRNQFANNLRRAAELTAVPDERILEIYNALRPYRSTKQELIDIANELDHKYGAKVNADFIREAAEVYERRNRLKVE